VARESHSLLDALAMVSLLLQAEGALAQASIKSKTGGGTPGALQHIAVTANTNTGLVIAYVDGVPVPLTATYGPGSISGTFSTVHNLYLGRRQDASPEGNEWGSAYFPGLLDEISLYSSELSESEIQAIVAAGAGGKCR